MCAVFHFADIFVITPKTFSFVVLINSMGIKFCEDLYSRVFVFATFANEREIKHPRNSLSSNKVLCFLGYFWTLTFCRPFVSLLFLT